MNPSKQTANAPVGLNLAVPTLNLSHRKAIKLLPTPDIDLTLLSFPIAEKPPKQNIVLAISAFPSSKNKEKFTPFNIARMEALYLGACDIERIVQLPPEPPYSQRHHIKSEGDNAYGYVIGNKDRSWDTHQALPWAPSTYVSYGQLIFRALPAGYFDLEEIDRPEITLDKAIEIVRRYYRGWHSTYTQVLSGTKGLDDAQLDRVTRSMENLLQRRQRAVDRIEAGDMSVLTETLEEVRTDRRMAVGMPRTQVEWSTEWIQEVWMAKDGHFW